MGVKLGNGKWAIKEDKLLAYNDNSGRFFNKEFDFSRGSSATYVAKDGLIKNTTGDIPRIDFTDTSKGALLLEPQSTNLITYSEALSNWTNIQNVTVTDNDIISPDGTLNASRINETTSNSVHRLFLNPTVASAKHTYSAFLKKGTRSWACLRLDGNQTEQRTWFDLENGVLGTVNADHIASIENFGNGWYRCSVSILGTTYDTTPLAILALATDNNVITYTGNTDKYIYAWGAQLEQQSFATSYIPTSGSTVTRNAEVCNNSGSAQDFNSEEGVLYAEIAALANDGTNRRITISDGTTTNRLILQYRSASNEIAYYFVVGGVNQCAMIYTLSNATQFSKIALKYKTNDFALWVDGTKVMIDTFGDTMDVGTLSRFDFDGGTGLPFYGNVKSIAVFTETLTDEQLQKLTS